MNIILNSFFLIALVSSNLMYSQDDMALYKKLAMDFTIAMESSNSEDLADLFTTDAVMTTQEGYILSDANQIEDYFDKTFGMITYENLVINITEMIKLNDQLVYGRGDFTSKIKTKDNQVREASGFFSNVVRIEDGKWKLYRHLVMFPQVL